MKLRIKIIIAISLLACIIGLIACKTVYEDICPEGGTVISDSGNPTDWIVVDSEENCKAAAKIRGYNYYCFSKDHGCYVYKE